MAFPFIFKKSIGGKQDFRLVRLSGEAVGLGSEKETAEIP